MEGGGGSWSAKHKPELGHVLVGKIIEAIAFAIPIATVHKVASQMSNERTQVLPP